MTAWKVFAEYQTSGIYNVTFTVEDESGEQAVFRELVEIAGEYLSNPQRQPAETGASTAGACAAL